MFIPKHGSFLLMETERGINQFKKLDCPSGILPVSKAMLTRIELFQLHKWLGL